MVGIEELQEIRLAINCDRHHNYVLIVFRIILGSEFRFDVDGPYGIEDFMQYRHAERATLRKSNTTGEESWKLFTLQYIVGKRICKFDIADIIGRFVIRCSCRRMFHVGHRNIWRNRAAGDMFETRSRRWCQDDTHYENCDALNVSVIVSRIEVIGLGTWRRDW